MESKLYNRSKKYRNWLQGLGFSIRHYHVERAAYRALCAEDVGLLRFLYRVGVRHNHFNSSTWLLHQAARDSRLAFLHCFWRMGFDPKQFANAVLFVAMKENRVEVLRWLHTRGLALPHVTAELLAVTAGEGNVEVFEWMWSAGLPTQNYCTAHVVAVAALNGRARLLDWLRLVGVRFDICAPDKKKHILRLMAAKGMLEALRSLQRMGATHDDCAANNVLGWAVEAKQHSVVRWLLEDIRVRVSSFNIF